MAYEELVARVSAEMPELPEGRRRRFMEQYDLSFSDASQLTSERSLADYYEQAAETSGNSRSAANWIRSELLRELQNAGLTAGASAPEQLVEQVVTKLREWGAEIVEEQRGKTESVSFPVPKPLRENEIF